MPHLFEAKDKTGRTVYLTDERYRHIQKHPEMRNSVDIIKQAIEKPQKITASPMEQSVQYFYTHHKHRKSPAKYLRAIVKYLNGEGFIITAYFVLSIV